MTNQPQQATWYQLSELSLVYVSGADARDFLQGQLSNDINLLSIDAPHQLSAYCNPKGRMLALFQVLQLETGYALIAPRAIIDRVLPRLKMFVMRAAVELTQHQQPLYGLRMPAQSSLEEVPGLDRATSALYRHGSDPQRYFVIGEWGGEVAPEPFDAWNRIDVEQCLPQLYIENYEALIPQSINLDIIGGVNFKKGCYPGQEIIARVKYRGKPKTRMIRAQAHWSDNIKTALPIFIEGRESPAGMVINVARSGERALLNISVPVTHLTQGDLYLGRPGGEELQRLECPYEISS